MVTIKQLKYIPTEMYNNPINYNKIGLYTYDINNTNIRTFAEKIIRKSKYKNIVEYACLTSEYHITVANDQPVGGIDEHVDMIDEDMGIITLIIYPLQKKSGSGGELCIHNSNNIIEIPFNDINDKHIAKYILFDDTIVHSVNPIINGTREAFVFNYEKFENSIN